jgi:predicted acetyltransferase
MKWPEEDRSMNDFYGLFRDNTLAAGIGRLPLNIRVGGIEFKANGIDGVATKPEYRNKGFIRKIFTRMFLDAFNDDLAFSVLYPFKVSFYESLGYYVCDETVYYQFELENIKFKKTNYFMREIQEIDTDMKKFYERMNKKFDYIANRDYDWQWKRLNKEYFKFICFNPDKKIVGYCLLFFPSSDTRVINEMEKKNETLLVTEIFYSDHEAKQEIFNLLRNHRDQREYGGLVLPKDENVIDLFHNPRIYQRKIKVNSMLRIINLKKVLETLEYPKNDFQITLDIKDPYCNWNNKIWLLKKKSGEIEVKELKSAQDLDLTIDIGRLTQLICGFRSIKELWNYNLVELNEEKIDLIESIFPQRTRNYFYDFF